jgi:peptide/nickel transport system permease protein
MTGFMPGPAPVRRAARRRPRGFTSGVRVVWSNRLARLGIAMLAFFVLVAIFAPWLAPYDPHDSDFDRRLPPSGAHWLGTTATGEDVFSQLVVGTRVSVVVGLVAGALATIVAVAVGLTWGYVRPAAGEVMAFGVNLFLVVPALPLMVVFTAYLDKRGLSVIIIVVALTGWAWGARVLRAQTTTLRSRDFVTAARFSGDSGARIVFREIMPNMTSLIVSSFIAAAIAAVGAEAGLAFLGLGDPSTISWGTMLFWAQNGSVLLTGEWLQVLVPGLCIALLCMSLVFINFGVDAVSNPRLRRIGRR